MSAARLSSQQHVVFEDSLRNGTVHSSTQSVKSLLSTTHNASAEVDKSRRSGAVQELLGILANEMQNKQPLPEFLPVCLAHVKRLIAAIDRSYTDVQLQFMLEHECWLVKTFPHAYSHGFESHRACKCFSEKLVSCRMWELHDGSQERYTEFCTAYFNDPNAEGIEECTGKLPPETWSSGPLLEPSKAVPGAPNEAVVKSADDGVPAELGKAQVKKGPDAAARGVADTIPLGAGTPGSPEPTVEPPFLPGAADEADDKEIEEQMKQMQDRIEKDVKEAKVSQTKQDGPKSGKLASGKRAMRDGQKVKCPYKSGSYEWCDYIIDGEPTLDKAGVAWDSESRAKELAKEVKDDTLVGDGPEAHVIVPGEPLSPEAKKRMEEARKRNLAKRASGQQSQEEAIHVANHWKKMQKLSNQKQEAAQAYKDRYRNQWERMKQVSEKKKLRKQVERDFYREKSWPWPKDEAEWDNTDVQQRPKLSPKAGKQDYPAVHSLAACAVSPFVLLVGILLLGTP